MAYYPMISDMHLMTKLLKCLAKIANLHCDVKGLSRYTILEYQLGDLLHTDNKLN